MCKLSGKTKKNYTCLSDLKSESSKCKLQTTECFVGVHSSRGIALIHIASFSGSLGKICLVTPGGTFLPPFPDWHLGTTQDMVLLICQSFNGWKFARKFWPNKAWINLISFFLPETDFWWLFKFFLICSKLSKLYYCFCLLRVTEIFWKPCWIKVTGNNIIIFFAQPWKGLAFHFIHKN